MVGVGLDSRSGDKGVQSPCYMVKVKVCGIKELEDARVAADAGADAIGLVFAESPRRVSAEQAREIASILPDGVFRVGVFADEEPREVLRLDEGP
jgi:phosphoribosylanthranilate isomerase